MRDLHVHTEFSCDSEAGIEEYAQKGIRDGFGQICFTDHVDLNTDDYGYDYYDAEAFFQRFNSIKEKYKDRIELLAGFEFGEPHLYYNKLQELSKLPYDYIIGSVHWIGNMFPCQKVREQYSANEFYTLYWQEVLKTVKIGGFDALGHIDFPKRYYGEIYYEESVLNEIFKNIIEKDLVIEINTSSLRKGHMQTMPGKELLEMYQANGGKYVTIGSDAHVVEDLGEDYVLAKDLLTEVGLQEVIYRKRERKLLSEDYVIKKISQNNILECVTVIRESFATVAAEFNITKENAPRFTAFATDEQRLEYHLNVENRPMYGIFVDGKLVGYYSLLLMENHECELNNLCVLPDYRHKKIGNRLLEHAFNTARGMDCIKMNIGIVEENKILRDWYELYGFVHTKTEKYDFFPFTCGYMIKNIG